MVELCISCHKKYDEQLKEATRGWTKVMEEKLNNDNSDSKSFEV
jgi:hypothetical protein